MKDILSQTDILFLQEHCLYEKQISELNQLGDIGYHGVSPMDENVPLLGRPFGGCAIIWKNSINARFTPIVTDNNRLCAGTLQFSGGLEIFLMSVYLPCDNRQQGDSYLELVDTLNRALCLIQDCTSDVIVLGGDLNTDFSRTTPQVSAVKEFITASDLCACLDHTIADIDYTYESHSNGCKSLLDHILVSNNVFADIKRYSTLPSVDNLSDHDALICVLKCDVTSIPRIERKFKEKAAWYKATSRDIAKYKNRLDTLLSEITLDNDFLTCDNISCVNHRNDISTLLANITDCFLEAESECIPQTGGISNHRIPGWNDFIEGKRREALHWHHRWVDLGRPQEGHIADEMRRTRKDYHYTIRQCRRDANQIRCQKMAESLTKNRRNFWSEVRQCNRSHRDVPSSVDGATDSEDIVNIFYSKFQDLYSSVPYSQSDMEQLENRINEDLIHSTRLDYKLEPTTADICKMIKKMKTGKGDGQNGLMSDGIINGPNRLYVLIAVLFRTMLTHGFTPATLLLGTMSPIPKQCGMVYTSEKYRAITLVSCILKLLDHIIIQKQCWIFESDPLQFGFKSNSSTTLCSSMMIETIRLFNSQGSKVHAVLLDASKAFDRVEFTKLFGALLDKGMDAMYSRYLLNMYLNQKLCISWNGYMSGSFSVKNGVRQGGVISPLLFAVYLDILIRRLRDSGFGCYCGPFFVGCMAYADDIVLLSPTKYGLSRMLDICNNYALEFQLQFNGQKSQFIVFHTKSNVTNRLISVNVFGSVIYNEDSVIHLGHRIFSNTQKDDFDGIISSYYRQFNIFRSRFGGIASSVQAELFHTYCTSFYGCLLQPFRKIDRLCVVLRKSLRLVWRVPWRTHCGIIASLSQHVCGKHMFISRFMNFAKSSLSHNSEVVKFVMQQTLKCDASIFRGNLALCCKECNTELDNFTMTEIPKVLPLCTEICKNQYRTEAVAVQELADIRDNISDCGLTSHEAKDFLEFLCIY